MDFEYRVIPAPKRLKKIKGVSSAADLFAATLTDAINAEARDGWEYIRAESLSAEQPGGFLRRAKWVEETVMIFRRPRRRETPREPSLREVRPREPAQEQPEAHGPTLRTPPSSERTRPLASLFARGESPRPEPTTETRPRTGPGGPATPPLLRPVPRHKPGEKP